MNWSARGNVLNQYLRNTSIGTTVNINNVNVHQCALNGINYKSVYVNYTIIGFVPLRGHIYY
jgi:hypothetical protein